MFYKDFEGQKKETFKLVSTVINHDLRTALREKGVQVKIDNQAIYSNLFKVLQAQTPQPEGEEKSKELVRFTLAKEQERENRDETVRLITQQLTNNRNYRFETIVTPIPFKYTRKNLTTRAKGKQLEGFCSINYRENLRQEQR